MEIIPVWVLSLLSLAVSLVSAYAVFRRHNYGLAGLVITGLLAAFYYSQIPVDFEAVRYYGRPIAALLYLSIITHNLTILLSEHRRKHG